MKILDEYLSYIQEDTIQEVTPLVAAGIASSALSIFFTLLAGYKNYLSKAAKACDGIVDIKLKNKCMVDYKLRGAEQFKTKLGGAKNKCGDNEGCKNKYDRKIQAMNTNIEKYRNQIRTINL